MAALRGSKDVRFLAVGPAHTRIWMPSSAALSVLDHSVVRIWCR